MFGKKSTYKIAEDRMKEMQKRYEIMDKTKDLAYLSPYTLMKMKNNKEVKVDDAISVTMNDPAVEGDTIVSDLLTAIWQTVVEGDVSEKQKHKIEEFIEDNLAQADEQLAKMGMPPLFSWLCNHVCFRSYIGCRWISQVIKGVYSAEAMPVDMRWTPHEYGRGGLTWVGAFVWKNKGWVESTYGLENLSSSGKIEVLDWWDGENNEVWVDKKLVKISTPDGITLPQKNPFGYPPFVIDKPATGFMLTGKEDEYIEHEAEDIYYLNRNLYKEKNRSASIEATLGMDVLLPAYEQETENPTKDKPDEPPTSGKQQIVGKGEKHFIVPKGDLNNASLTYRQDLQRAIQRGGVNDVDRGDVDQTPAITAVWITTQSEIRNKIRRPRLNCLASFYSQLYRMMIDQYQRNTGSFEIGVVGKKRKYAPNELGDPQKYSINVEGMSQSKKQEIANMAIAQAAQSLGMPDEDIVKNILLVDDPDGYMRRKAVQKAGQVEPIIELIQQGLRLIEEADEFQETDKTAAEARRIEAMLLRDRIISMKNQPVEQTKEKPIAGNQLISLMGKGA